jgi:CRISPR-associated protein Csm3
MTLQLTHILHLSGVLILRTGLHIGAGKNDIVIGGLDNSVQRDPATRLPVIPGSSLKGKLRILLEWRYGLQGRDNGPYMGEPESQEGAKVLRIFGALPKVGRNEVWPHGPGRLKVADLKVISSPEDPEDLFEEKPETAINRLTGTAAKGTLRTTERVVSGTEFRLDIAFRCFASDNLKEVDEFELFHEVLQGLELVALDGLGGSTSRGYGRVGFSGLELRARVINPADISSEDWTGQEPWKTHIQTLHAAGVNA